MAITIYPNVGFVNVTNLNGNSALETGGQLQRIANALEVCILELRVQSAILASLGQSMPDDPETVRNDIASLN
jgi:hypothetical protein